jgi:aspartyl-tRNA(Asn)/glutamyl-tRNA(Gln) amidotransferase subunit B
MSGSRSAWEAVIGLEVHVQLQTRTKAFCGCPVEFAAPPNTLVCPVCLGLPGALPVLNEQAVEDALLVACALECEVKRTSVFARKNYFYPDLPKGYQISQYEEPLARGGRLSVLVDGEELVIPLERVHLEEDAGKSLHGEGAGALTRLDYNRCGTPLLEIVTKPALRAPSHARAFLRALRQLVQYLGVSDADMSRGNLRCDANVSVRRVGETALGAKTEVKNLNSIRAVERALAAEIERQSEVLAGGGDVRSATVLWDEKANAVVEMRGKEGAPDYRYFPEPDLPPLVIDAARLEKARSRLPELPFARRARIIAEYGVAAYDADVLTSSRPLADWFEELARAVGDGRVASKWTLGEVSRALKEHGGSIAEFPVGPLRVAELIALVREVSASHDAAKKVFAKMVATGRGARAIFAAEGIGETLDEAGLDRLVAQVLAENPGLVTRILAGERRLSEFLMGRIMAASGGRVDPRRAREVLEEALDAAESS